MKVLVVEDNPLNLTLLCSSLTDRLGCEVITAKDGRQALEHLRSNPDIGLVITDLHMPGFHGLLMLEHIRENPKWERLPIIVCTSDSSRDTVLKVANLGVNHFLCKPVRMSMLKDKMKLAFAEKKTVLPSRLKIMLQLDIDLNELRNLQEKVQESVLSMLRDFAEGKSSSAIQEADLESMAQALWPSLFRENTQKLAGR